MKKTLSIIVSALALLFAVPTILILASWNALPGDSIFPVKTGLEKIALRIVGGTQLERRLEVKYTERRFSEADKLLSQQSTVGLTYFVPQAQTAKEKVIKAQDIKTKEKLVADLTEFNQKLEERKEKIATITPTPTPPASPTTIPPSSPAAISPPSDILPSPSTSSEPEKIIEAIEYTQEEIEEIIEELKKEVSTPPDSLMQEEHEPQGRSEPPVRR